MRLRPQFVQCSVQLTGSTDDQKYDELRSVPASHAGPGSALSGWDGVRGLRLQVHGNAHQIRHLGNLELVHERVSTLIEADHNEELAENLGKLVILKISKQKHPSPPALS